MQTDIERKSVFMLMACQTERPATLWHHLLIMRQDRRNALGMNQTVPLLANNMRSDSRLTECFEIRLRVHTVFGGPGLCEWICLCIDVCVLCLSHSSGLVWPVCKQACTTSGDKAAKGRARAAGMQGCREREEACQETPGPSRKGKSDNSFSIFNTMISVNIWILQI